MSPISSAQKRRVVAQIKRHTKIIEQSRNALRALMDDVEAICDTADEAVEDLTRAVESLSKYL